MHTEQPALESRVLGERVLESADDGADSVPASEGEGAGVAHKSCEVTGSELRDVGQAFSDDSSFNDSGHLKGTKGFACGGCIKNGKVYKDLLDFVFV